MLFIVLLTFYVTGGILLGLLWLALSYALWTRRDLLVEQATHVS